jgi:hypothetical protein
MSAANILPILLIREQRMQTKTQLRLIISLLIIVGLGAAMYKNQVLGFSFFPETKVNVWTIEAKIGFMAEGGPVKVILNGADNAGNMVALNQETVGEKYLFTKEYDEDGNVKGGIWEKESAEGEQVIFFRTSAYRMDKSSAPPRLRPLVRPI